MNFMRTAMLLAALTAIFMGVGYLIGGAGGMVIAFLIAAGMNLFAYWNADKMVLVDERRPRGRRAHRARVLSRSSTTSRRRPACRCRGSMSSTTRSRTPSPPAAIPRTPPSPRPPGCSRSLSREEIAAVMAHELGHVKNRDTLTMTITATIAGAISMLANFALLLRRQLARQQQPARLRRRAGRRDRRADRRAPRPDGGEPDARIFRRPRRAPRSPAGRRGSSRRSPRSTTRRRQIPNAAAERNPAMAHLFIINPLSGARMDNLFSTHPSTENRIAALQAMEGEFGGRPAALAVARSAPRVAVPRVGRTGSGL